MPVQEQTPYIKYVANGVTQTFATEFDCESKDQLVVMLNGEEPSFASWSYADKQVTFLIAPVVDTVVELKRQSKLNRTTDYQSFNHTLNYKALNSDFDRIWYAIQEQNYKAGQYDYDYNFVLTQVRPINTGGTGANNVFNARSNLDVYSKSEVLALVQTGGAGEVLSIESGGTSGVTAEEARTNLDVYSKDEIDAKGIYPVGSIRWWNGKASMIPDGCVPLSGTLLNRASYPDLWADIQAGVYDVIEDTVWLSNPDRRWAFSVGDGSTTFRLPDYNGIQSGSIKSPVLRGSGYSNPSIKSDAIRNITGSVNAIRMGIGWTPQSTGALLGQSAPNSGDAYNGSAATMTIDIDASRVVPTADENRPNSLFGIWIIQARGTTRQAPAQGSSATLLSNTFDGNQKINGDLEVTGTLNANIKPLLNAQGDAPISACRAWVNFSASGGVITVKGSLNIASVTRVSAGVYTVKFNIPMPIENYAVFVSNSGNIQNNSRINATSDTSNPTIKTVNSVQVAVSGTSAFIDTANMSVGVFC